MDRFKKIIYITTFTILGLWLQFLIHVILEISYINLLLRDFSKYSFGLSWEQWIQIHHFGAAVLVIAGLIFGFWQGVFWWRKIYEKK